MLSQLVKSGQETSSTFIYAIGVPQGSIFSFHYWLTVCEIAYFLCMQMIL